MSDLRLALAEERSLALHRLVAERLREDPTLLDRARERVGRWLAEGPVSRPAAEAWQVALAGSLEDVVATLIDPGERASRLRRSSPFAGVIDARTRWNVWRSTRVAARS